MSKTHARLSPSKSSQWINCPGSIRFVQESIESGAIKPATSSIYADEGTIAHELAEKALTSGQSPFRFEGQTCEYDSKSLFAREMCEYVQQYVDFVKLFDGQLLVEQHVKFTDWVPDGSGTSDAVIIQENRIVCIDLKYGQGLPVEAENNTQALCYALGVYQSLLDAQRAKIKTVLMVIHQPRLDRVTEWEISKDELLRWGERIAQAAELALSDNAPLIAGKEQCFFCQAKSICKKQYQLMVETVGQDFDDLTCQRPANALNDAELRRVLEAKEQIVSWLSAVEGYVTDRLASGDTFPGFKLVEGRSLRQWSSEDEAADVLSVVLGDDAYTRKLISPAQAEKALGKANAKTIQELITKPPGKPTLVPESDKRPALGVSVDDF